MQRVYLEEDLRLIQKYFPGAKTVALHTPFDLTKDISRPSHVLADVFHDDISSLQGDWTGGILWTN